MKYIFTIAMLFIIGCIIKLSFINPLILIAIPFGLIFIYYNLKA